MHSFNHNVCLAATELLGRDLCRSNDASFSSGPNLKYEDEIQYEPHCAAQASRRGAWHGLRCLPLGLPSHRLANPPFKRTCLRHAA